MTPTTVSKSFINWMQDNGYGLFKRDIFLNQVPDTDDNNEPINNAYWIITSGGDGIDNLVTRQNILPFIVQVNYRNISGQTVEDTLFALAKKVNTRYALQLDGFEIFSIESSSPQDNDRDAENRRQGSLDISIRIYESYVS